jgi:HAD superfamily hydrolase (TIGR01509 family)
MKWIHDYQLFLFDFDGLLVNTEEIHFKAYQRMTRNRGFELDWSFDRYCQNAHYSSELLREEIFNYLPELKQNEPDWEILYAEKRAAMIDLLNEGQVHLMPGVVKLLKELEKADIKRCVVTHSPDLLISIVRNQNPILNTIPFWITREHYHHPKPNPECYQKAIQLHARDHDNVIGFEDTPRGMTALMQTRAIPIMVCETHYKEIPEFLNKGARVFKTFEEVNEVMSALG